MTTLNKVIEEEPIDAEESALEETIKSKGKPELIGESIGVASQSEDHYEDDFLKSSGLITESVGKKNRPEQGSPEIKKYNSPISSAIKPFTHLKPVAEEDNKDSESIEEENVPAPVEEDDEYKDEDFE